MPSVQATAPRTNCISQTDCKTWMRCPFLLHSFLSCRAGDVKGDMLTLLLDCKQEAQPSDEEQRSDAASRECAIALAKVAWDTKAEDISVLHVAPLVYWCSYMVVLTIKSRPQLQAVLAKLEKEAAEKWDRRISQDASTGRLVQCCIRSYYTDRIFRCLCMINCPGCFHQELERSSTVCCNSTSELRTVLHLVSKVDTVLTCCLCTGARGKSWTLWTWSYMFSHKSSANSMTSRPFMAQQRWGHPC